MENQKLDQFFSGLPQLIECDKTGKNEQNNQQTSQTCHSYKDSEVFSTSLITYIKQACCLLQFFIVNKCEQYYCIKHKVNKYS